MNWTIEDPYFEITSQCNLLCKHCYNASSSKNHVQLSRKNILECLNFFSIKGVKNLSISGGEPLIHIDIKEILHDAHERNFQILLATNGTLLSKEIIEKICEYVSYYQVSVDGDKLSHELIRGKGSYEMAWKGIRQLCIAGLQKRTRLRMTISRYNYDKISTLIENAAAEGLGAVHFSVVRGQGRAKRKFEDLLRMPDESLIALYYEINSLRCKYKGIIDISPLTVDGGECTLLKENPVIRPRIDARGDIYPCEGYTDPIFRLGNLNEGLPMVFSDDRVLLYLNQLKEMRQKSKKCNDCIWSKITCLRGCPAEAHSLGNDIGTDGLCGVRKAIWRNRLTVSRE